MKDCSFKDFLLNYYMKVVQIGLKNEIGILFMSILFALFISPASATSINQQIEINGTANINTTFANDEVVMEQAVNIDGVAYLNITYVDGSTRLMELEQYILENQDKWSTDKVGCTVSSFVNVMVDAVQYLLGETNTSSEAMEIGRELDKYFASDGDLYYLSMELNNMKEVLQTHHNVIQNILYEVEAFYITLEKTNADIYCESRREVAKKYNLTNVKCGLHSKICYNGNLNKLEGGRDFCIHTDNDKDYLPCYSRRGMCGHLEDIKLLESEANSYIPIVLTFWNPGTMTLNPSLKVEVEKDHKTIKLFEEELGEVFGMERKTFNVFLNNSGINPGNYTILITVSSGRKDIIDKFEYELLPEGTLERKGEFSSTYSKPKLGREMEIKSNYKNTNNYSYSVKVVADVYLNDEKIDTLESEKVFLKPGDNQNFTLNYKVLDPGNYKIVVGVENSNIQNIIDFSLNPPSITGRFLTDVSNLPNLKKSIILILIIVAVFLLLLLRFLYKIKTDMRRIKKELQVYHKAYLKD